MTALKRAEDDKKGQGNSQLLLSVHVPLRKSLIVELGIGGIRGVSREGRCSPGEPPFAYAITDQLSPGDEIIGEHPGLDSQGLFDGLNKRPSGPTFPDLSGPDLWPCWMRLVLVQEQDPHPIERAKK